MAVTVTTYPVPPEGKLGPAPTTATTTTSSVGDLDAVTPLDIALLFPWLPGPLIAVFDEAWTTSGDVSLALQAVYAAPELETFFPGIRRDDGTLRMDPLSYLSQLESYRAEFAGLGLNPDLFEGKFASLIEGEVSTGELKARLDDIYERVLSQGDFIREDFATQFGVTGKLTNAAILAGAIDPNIGQALLEERISLAEISGEASDSGFTINIDEARKFFQGGFNRQSADEFFQTAEDQLGILDELAKRHLDPDDTFSLSEFAEGVAFSDPTQQRRVRRLLARERATFTGVQNRVAQNSQGLLSGLRVQ